MKKIKLLLICSVLFSTTSFALRFGTVSIGKEAGNKAVKKFKQEQPVQPPPEIPDDPRFVWVSDEMEGWIYWSSVAISTETKTIYVGTSGMAGFGGDKFTNALYAIDMNTGKIKWRYNLDENHVVKGPIVISPDGTLYFIAVTMVGYNVPGPNPGTHLYAVNPDGTLKWKKINLSLVEPHFWGAESPAVDSDGNIYVHLALSYTTQLGVLICFDPSGKEKWRYEGDFAMGGGVWPTPLIVGDTIYLMTNYRGLYAIDKSTGGVLWCNSEYYGQDITPPVIADDGTIYASAGNQGQYLIAYTSTGSIKWIFDAKAKILTPPVLGEDGTIYLGTTAKDMTDPTKIAGYFWAIDPSTGGVKWMFNIDQWIYDEIDKTTKPADIYASPVVGKDGTIYFTCEYRYLWALNPDGTLKDIYDLDKMTAKATAGSVTYSALVIDENGVLYKASSYRRSENEKQVGIIMAIQTQSYGLANSTYPKGYLNYKNTNSK